MSLLISNLLWKMTFLMRKIPLKIAATAATIKLIWTKCWQKYKFCYNFYFGGENCKLGQKDWTNSSVWCKNALIGLCGKGQADAIWWFLRYLLLPLFSRSVPPSQAELSACVGGTGREKKEDNK